MRTNRGPDRADQGAESVYQGANRAGFRIELSRIINCHIDKLCKLRYMGGNSPEGKMSETECEYAAN